MQKWALQKRTMKSGFTIVELLIVIVVIAILAAITIVSYNGVTNQAKDAVIRVDVRGIMQQTELFSTGSASYPQVNVGATSPAPELEEILRKAGLYEDTRYNEGAYKKAFVFCGSTDGSQFIVIGMPREMMAGGSWTTKAGVPLTYDKNGAMATAPFAVDPSMSDLANNMCKSVEPSFTIADWRARWSFDVPTLKAP